MQIVGFTSFQKELWLSHLSLPDKHPGIFCGGLFELDGVPDAESLRASLTILVQYFPLLSATLKKTAGTFPVFEMGSCSEPHFVFLDLSNENDPAQTARQWLQDFAEEPFTPFTGHLCDFALLRLSATKSLFINRFFHLVCDGITCISHFNIMARIYAGLNSANPVIQRVSPDWRDDVQQDQTHLVSDRARADKAFWQKYLSSLPKEALFSPRLNRPDRVDILSRFDYDLPAAMQEQLQHCALSNSVGIADILMALHIIVLASLYDKKHVTLQVPLRFGERRDQWAFHGYRIHVVPLCVKIHAESTFATLLGDIKRQMRSLMRRIKTPFQQAFRGGDEKSELSRIWDTNFNFISLQHDCEMDGVKARTVVPVTSNLDPVVFGIYALQTRKDTLLQLSIDYSRNHFSKQDVLKYLSRMEMVLNEVVHKPETLLSKNAVVLPYEHAAIRAWQAGEQYSFPQGSIPDLFEGIATQCVGTPAIIGDGEIRSYQALSERSNGIAAWLIASGTAQGDVVAVFARRHVALGETILGIMKAGAIYLPVDPEYPKKRIHHMLIDSAAKRIVALEPEDVVIASSRLSAEILPKGLSTKQQPLLINADSAAYLIYTSGSTGIPKGVLVPHHAFVNMIQAQIRFFGISPEDRVLQFASPSFDASLSEIFMALLSGARLYPVSRQLIDEPWSLRGYMIEHAISVVTFPPSYLRLFNKGTFPGLRVLLTAGESPIADDACHYAAALDYFNAYGPTETSVCATIAHYSASSCKQVGNIGRPIANTSVYILDRMNRPVAPGIPGELCVAGPGLAIGYLNRPELTSDRFVQIAVPNVPKEQRVYRTGDQAAWTPNGEIMLLGRLDEQVKIRGHRVEPGEVSKTLEEHPEIVQAEVLAATLREQGLDLIAFLIEEIPGKLQGTELRDWLRQRLPDHMIPTRFQFVRSMPTAATGKVDRQKLIRHIQKTVGKEADTTQSGSELEEEVRTIFAEILGEPVNSLSRDFFSLGGDSIRLITLTRSLDSHFKKTLSFRQVLVDASVSGIAAQLSNIESNTVLESGTGELLPLSQAQYQLWVLDQMGSPSAQYNMPFAVEIEAEGLREDALEQALLKAVNRQASCCAVVAGEIDTPELLLQPSSMLHIERQDVRSLAKQESTCEQLFDECIHRAFCLTEAPLLRGLLLRLSSTRWRLLLVMHHIIGDAVSLQIILKDMFASLQNKELKKVPPQQLADFVTAEKLYLNSSEAVEDLAWWTKRLLPLPAPLNLVHQQRPPGKDGRGDLLRRPLTATTAHGLTVLAKEASTTQLASFLTLVFDFIGKETGHTDVAIGLPVGLRDRALLHDVAGYFVNTVVVRARQFHSNPNLVSRVREIGADLLQAVQHSRYPFPLLAKALDGERNPSRSPLVDILVTEIDEAALFADISLPEGLRISPVDVVLRASKLDFSFILHRRVTGSSDLVLEYDTDIASPEEASSLVDRFERFLNSALAEFSQVESVEKESTDEIMQQLVSAWQQVLGVTELTPESNFFSCGGDSIKAIQIVGQLRRQGITGITPGELFSKPTLGQIYALARAGKGGIAAPLSGSVCKAGDIIPLLPLQKQLFQKHPEHWSVFHMVLPLSLDKDVDITRLRQAVHELPGRHEAFRLAFLQSGEGRLREFAAEVIWEETVIQESLGQDAIVREAVRRLFDALDLENGKLFGAILVHCGNSRLLLIGGHHLVLDAVSLDILHRELAWYCRYGTWPKGEERCSPLTWAAKLAEQSRQGKWQQEYPKWQDICVTPGALLPGFNPAATDRAAERIVLTQRFVLSQALSNRPVVQLLAALAQALHVLKLDRPVLVTMEGHGREAIFPGLDVSQTVGWFTTTYPLLLSPSPHSGHAAEQLSDWFAGLGSGGLGYGALSMADGQKLGYTPQISFNYLGRLVETEARDGFSPLPELATPGNIPTLLHPDFCSDAPLDLMMYGSAQDELVILAYFSPKCIDEEWLRRLLGEWEKALVSPVSFPKKWQELAAICLCKPDEIEALYRLTANQEAMFYQQQLDGPGSLTYTQQISFRLQGHLEEGAFLDAWRGVTQRHAGLRSIFPTSETGDIHWLVLKNNRNVVEYIDLRTVPTALQHSMCREKLHLLRQRDFALDKGPLFFMQLFRLSDDSFEMSWCFHHILMDGWCIGILLRELFSSYAALRCGQTLELAPVPSWHGYQQWRDNYDDALAKRYWQKNLAGFEHPTPIARSENRQGNSPFVRQEEEYRLGSSESALLQKIARRENVSLAILLQSLWGLLLSTENDDCDEVLFGLITSGRPADVEGIENMLGLFIQTIPVRIHISCEDGFFDLLSDVQAQALSRAPFEFLSLADIQIQAPQQGALFDHILVFENYPVDGLSEDGAPIITGVSGFEQHPYNFGLSIVPGSELLFRFSWNPDQIEKSHIAALLLKWQTVFNQLLEAENPTCLQLIQAMTSHESKLKGEVPALFNETRRPYPRNSSIADVFEEITARNPLHTALIGYGQDVWSYQKLNSISAEIAAKLADVIPGEPVAFAMERGPAAIAVMLGILKAGGCYLPIDTKNPGHRVQSMLQIAGCRRVIHDEKHLALLPVDAHIIFYTAEDLFTEPGAQNPSGTPGRTEGVSPAYILFTSGSSGEPKGVLVPHRAVMRLACNNGFLEINPEERVLQAGPLGFDASTLEVWATLLSGATLCFISDDDLLFPGGLKRCIQKENIRIMWLTASLCNLLVDEDIALFSPLRVVLTGGEALSLVHIEKLMAACPELIILNGYGPTENTTFTTTHRIEMEDIQKGVIPIGRPVANTRVHIVTEDGSLAMLGEWGELCAAGDGLALGYVGREELSRTAFVDLKVPFTASTERVYHTGDIARWRADGVLEFQGRLDSQVKIQGYRIEPGEIENALTGLSQVLQAAVVVAGQNELRQLVAYVRLAEKGTAKAIQHALAPLLPRYMIPDRIECLDSFPLTKNGKLDRIALTEMASTVQHVNKEEITADTLESRVAQLFSEVLNQPVHSPQADFYRMGGQSLKAMRLLSRLNREFQVELLLQDILGNTTVATVSQQIKELLDKDGYTEMVIPQLADLKEYPMSSGQERLWFLQHLQPRSSVYNVPFAIRLSGVIDAVVLQQALSFMEKRHDALRLRVPLSIGSKDLRQQIAPPGAVRLKHHDYATSSDPDHAIAEAVAVEVSRPFPFGYEHSLWRSMLLQENSNSSVLLLTFHHILCDGLSAEIFLHELFQAYESVLHGRDLALPPLALRYVEYASWQRDILSGSMGDALRKRWCARMTPLSEPLALATDRPRPSVRSFAGAVHHFHLDRQTSRHLSRFARESSTTLFSVLLCLVHLFLHRHSGQKDIVIGVPVAGRQQTELEPVMGYFVNTLPVRLHLDPKSDFSTLLTQLSGVWQQCLSDQIYPFEALVDALELSREASRNPLFDVLVALEENSWTAVQETEDFSVKPYPIVQRFSKMDLSFYFREIDEHLQVDIEYSSDLFDARTIARLAERFTVLVNSVLESPTVPIYTLSLLKEAERELLVNGFNETARDYCLDKNIDALFREQAVRNGEAVAICTADDTTVTFAGLDQQVELLAGQLLARGVTAGDHIGVSFERSPDLIRVIFAILRIGAIYVPFVPGLPKDRVAAMAEDLGQVLIISEAHSAEALRKGSAQVLTLAELSDAGNGAIAAPQSCARAEDPAYVLFTSGSTGRPKGVIIEHRGVLNRIQWMQSQFPLGSGDVILQKTPVSFDVSIWELFWWSWTGAALAQLPPGGEKDPAEIVSAIARNQATVIHFVPSMLQAFLHYLERNSTAVQLIASLRYVFASGEALTPDLVRRFNAVVYRVNGTELHNLYGPTEATVDVTWYPCSPFDDDSCVPIGRPVANTMMYVLDGFGTPSPIGVAGELFISGVQVARGYVNRPELTAEHFLDDPFSEGRRMYRTGDLARWRENGVLEYLGRTDHQVKVRGFRIELGEIEIALERIGSIAQAVVRVTELAGLPALEAFLLPRKEAVLSRQAICRDLESFLPDYMIPSLFYQLDHMPLNPSGKTDRKALTGVLLGAQSSSNPPGLEVLAPITQAVMEVWHAVLPEEVQFGTEDNFFEVGGNSILLIRLHELLESNWPGCFSLTDLFVSVTVAQQSECLESSHGSDIDAAPSVLASPREQSVAVIGMALRLADFDDPEAFWADLLAGADRTGSLSEQRQSETCAMLEAIGVSAQKSQIRSAAYLDDISGFDCKRFGLAPVDMTLLDPEQRIFLETAFRCLEDGGYGGAALANSRGGIFVGSSPSPSFKEAVSRSFQDRAEQAYVLNVPSNMASRLGYLLNWTGPAELVDTACSSSLKAVYDACHALGRGECDFAIAGSARVLFTPLRSGKAFTIETSSGKTRSFDAAADGVGAGEGSVVFLLKPLAQAQADGDAIRAVIRGGAINQDGRSASIAAPNPAAQAEVIQAASQASGVDLTSLDFFEAHGTGTVLGDPIEIDGLRRAFANEDVTEGGVPLSSVKGNYGHLDAAAGAIGMAKAILALQHGIVPQQVHFTTPNPRINFHKAPVFVAGKNHSLNRNTQPWHCGVSAFGISGINVHLILEQAPERDFHDDDGSWHVVPLSAGSAGGLCSYVDLLLESLAARPDWPLAAITATLTTGREALAWRLAIPARNRKEFLQKLLDWRLTTLESELQAVTPSRQQIETANIDDAPAALQVKAAFLAGDTPVWPEEVTIIRLNLPPVPMDRITCWPQFIPQTAIQKKGGLIRRGSNSPSGQIYTVPVTEEQFWPVSEHRLAGRPALVGMAMLPMVAETMAPLSSLQIEDLSWLRPLVRAEVTAACLSVSPDRDGQQVVLSAQGDDGTWREYAQAHVTQISPVDRFVDLSSLQTEMSLDQSLPVESEDATVQVSRRWHCLQQLWRSSGGSELLALLQLPDEYCADLDDIPWHPAMLDVAASLTLDRPGFVPAGCREIRLLHPMTERCFALVTQVDPDAKDATALVTADCLVLNEQGKVLVEFNGLTFFPLATPEARLHSLQWLPLPKKAPVRGEGAVLLLGDAVLATQLGTVLTEQQRHWWQADIPVQEAACRDLLGKLQQQPVQKICYIVPKTGFTAWPLAEFLKMLLSHGLNQPLHFVIVAKENYRLTLDAEVLDASRLDSPDAALAMGIIHSLIQEEPLLTGRYLGLAAAVSAEAVLAELDAPFTAENDPVILGQGGLRYGPQLGAALSPADSYSLPEGSVTVCSGGLGAMALSLAGSINGKVALLHRGGFPSEEEWPTLLQSGDTLLRWRITQLQRLQADGVVVGLYSCDITNREELQQTLANVRSDLGAIRGIIHTAGVAGDGFLINKSQESFAAVLAPKVDGTRFLHELTLQDSVEFFVLAASRTGLNGAPGQTDYAAANAYLDAFALWRRRQGLPALSIDWNSWAQVGMAARSGALDDTVSAFDPAQAGSLLRFALNSDLAQLVVTMPGEMLPTIEQKQKTSDKKCESGAELSNVERVRQIWTEGLGYETSISLDDDFYALGGDSITGMQVINRINRELEQSFSLADLLSSSVLSDFVLLLDSSEIAQNEQPVLTAAQEQEDYPVSREQLAVIQAEASVTPHTGYNLPQFLKLPSAIDTAALEDALRQLIARHEILRSRFLAIDSSQPRMKILPELPFSLRTERLDTFSAQNLQALITPFDLAEETLFRALLLTSDAGEQILFLDIHHAVADARTIDILLADLMALYLGQELPRPGLQQKDAAWHQHTLAGVDADAARSYWLGRFSGELPLLDLPADHMRPPRHTNQGATASFTVPPEWLSGLRSLARSQATTPYNVILSLWSILLCRYAVQDELVLAIATDGRDREELSNTTGMFVALLPLRLRISEEELFSEVLRRNHLHHSDAIRYRSFSLNQLLTELQAPAMPERTALAEVTFSYMNFETVVHSDSNALMERFDVTNPSSKADLAIFTSDTPGHIAFALEYYTDLFDPERMELMGRHFLNLLGTLLDKGPELLLYSYSMLEEIEKQKVVGSRVPVAPENLTLISALRQQAAMHPQQQAVVCESDSLCWAEFLAGAERVAAYLQEMGIVPGDTVCLVMNVDVRLPALMAGILLSGAICSPGRPTGNQTGRIKAIISDTAESSSSHDAISCSLDRLWNGGGKAFVENPVAADPEDILFYCATAPEKSSPLSQETLLLFAQQASELGLQSEARVLVAPAADTIIGIQAIWAVLLNGGKLHLCKKPLQEMADLGFLQQDRIEVLIAGDGLARQLCAWQADSLQTLRHLIALGDLLDDAVLSTVIKRRCPDLIITTGLILSESGLLLTLRQLESVEKPYLRAGHPALNVVIRIVDQRERENPFAVWGRIVLEGLVADIHRRLTGNDLRGFSGRWHLSGELEFLKTGKMHSVAELQIRRVLFRCSPHIREAAVLHGDGGEWQAVIAVAEDVSLEQIRSDVRRQLPTGMSTIELSTCRRLPLTAEGEVSLTSFDDPGQTMQVVSAVSYSRAAIETKIIELFEELFQRKSITRDESFFELGGHSLLGLQIANRLADTFQWQLSIRDLFEYPTPAELAGRLLATQCEMDSITHIPTTADARFPLSHAQQRLYVLHHMEGGAVAYNMPFVFEISRNIDLSCFKQAIGELCARHEILRTVFVEEDGELFQVVRESCQSRMTVDFLQSDEREEAFNRFRTDALTAFDLTQAPLFHFHFCCLGEGDVLLSLVMHHIIGDGWSMQIMFGELLTFYEALVNGKEVSLQPLTVQYKDYAVWQEKKDWQDEAGYWKTTLAGAATRITFPMDHPLPEKRRFPVGVCSRRLDEPLMEGLRGKAVQESISLATLILTLFAAFLYRLTQQEDMLIGVGVAGREQGKIENLIGFFVNILPIRIQMSAETELSELLKSVNETFLEALERQDYPYDLLVREVMVTREVNGDALLNVMFEYQRFNDLSGINHSQKNDSPLVCTPLDLDSLETPGADNVMTAKYDLTLFVQDAPQGCVLRAEFDSEMFTTESVATWLEYLESFMKMALVPEREGE